MFDALLATNYYYAGMLVLVTSSLNNYLLGKF